ncbi:hypothetical protein J4E80_002639 [Alternaria sp. BMP 0032]|nr:hypothetical protein J4E80_002639 [Alternaria sp. BMP 0032]
MDSQAPKESISPLQSLPQEILSSVCSYLPQGALYQLTLVNKHIGQRVVPALYSSFSQNGGDSMQVRQYFRTAVREPELAERLRELPVLKTLILSGGGGFHMATTNMEAAIHSSPIEVLDFESFIALIELEVHYSHAADDLLPPNLCRLVICATTRDRECIMKDMETLAQKLSKRSNLDVTLKYRHYRKLNYKLPKLSELPSVFAKSDLNLSLYVYPVVGSSWYLIAKFDHRAAWLSQRPSETGAKELRAWSKRLDTTYNYRDIVLEEIKCMVEKHENLWNSKDYDLDFMLPIAYRSWVGSQRPEIYAKGANGSKKDKKKSSGNVEMNLVLK